MSHSDATPNVDRSIPPCQSLAIIGGGIGGLVLALCLDQVYNHTNKETLEIHVYESTAAYSDNAGGAIGLYSNGLRVLRNLSRGISPRHRSSAYEANCPTLLSAVREAGCEYIYRRWMRHDGWEVAVAREDELVSEVEIGDDGYRSHRETERATQRFTKNNVSILDKRGQLADRRPRGGSFGVVKETIDELKVRLSRLSIARSESTATTSTSLTTETDSLSSPRVEKTLEKELLSMGIRRWRYQQILYEHCQQVGVHIHFGKRLQSITSMPSASKEHSSDSSVLLHFTDGTLVSASLVIGADGINSKVRNYVANPIPTPDNLKHQQEYTPAYTGVTCLMGCANVPRLRGICFPSSATTKCHACYYLTRVPKGMNWDEAGDKEDDSSESSLPPESSSSEEYEQVFQIYFPSPIERPDTWRTLTFDEAKQECQELANRLRADGWDEQFLAPLESDSLTGVLRVGLRSREALDTWHVGGDYCRFNDEIRTDDNLDQIEEANNIPVNIRDIAGRAILLGDAAHPPVPYIGQGAMMAMEDSGTLALVLGHYCPIVAKETAIGECPQYTLDFSRFKEAMQVYESLRVQRTKTILGSSVQLGKTQQMRADSKLYNAWREWSIKAQVWAYGTLPMMRPGSQFDYMAKVEDALIDSQSNNTD